MFHGNVGTLSGKTKQGISVLSTGVRNKNTETRSAKTKRKILCIASRSLQEQKCWHKKALKQKRN